MGIKEIGRRSKTSMEEKNSKELKDQSIININPVDTESLKNYDKSNVGGTVNWELKSLNQGSKLGIRR